MNNCCVLVIAAMAVVVLLITDHANRPVNPGERSEMLSVSTIDTIDILHATQHRERSCTVCGAVVEKDEENLGRI